MSDLNQVKSASAPHQIHPELNSDDTCNPWHLAIGSTPGSTSTNPAQRLSVVRTRPPESDPTKESGIHAVAHRKSVDLPSGLRPARPKP
jgi:hypothetical protein